MMMMVLVMIVIIGMLLPPVGGGVVVGGGVMIIIIGITPQSRSAAAPRDPLPAGTGRPQALSPRRSCR